MTGRKGEHMEKIEAVIDALSVTEANVTEMQEIFVGKIQDGEMIVECFLDSIAQYDKLRGENSFKKMPFIRQIMYTYRDAMLRGYVCALRDVQKVQHSELEHMDD